MGKNDLLYRKVKEDILRMIDGLGPNERIPSRGALVSRYGVTRTTVDRAISELIGEGYLYSRDGSGTYKAARSQPTSSPQSARVASWGVILPNIMHDTYPGILRGVEDVAQKVGVNVVICNTDNRTDKQTQYIHKLIDSGVKGLVVIPAIKGEQDLEPFHRLRQERIPFVFCNRGIEGIEAPRVISNNFYGGYTATKHLAQNGYRRIAFVSRPLYSASCERYQGYISALAEMSLPFDERYVVFEESFDTAKPGYYSVKRMMEMDSPPDAVFCFNDVIAEGAFEALFEKGLEPGRDVGVVGYDDTHICERLPVKLTSVKFKTYESGASAARILLDMTSGKEIPYSHVVILQPELVVRESSRATASTNSTKVEGGGEKKQGNRR